MGTGTALPVGHSHSCKQSPWHIDDIDMNTTQNRDLNIWRNLSPLADGYIPARPRHYNMTQYSHELQRDCKIPVHIDLDAKPTIASNGETFYPVSAVYAEHLYYACHYMVALSKLEKIDS